MAELNIENQSINAPNSQINFVANRLHTREDFTAEMNRLKELSSPSAAWNSQDRRDAPECHPKTRKLPLSKLTVWLNGSDSMDGSVRFIQGAPGTGKTTLVQTLARQVARTRQLGASFFFIRSSLDRRSLEKFAPTIARQLITSIPQLQPLICSTLRLDQDLFSKSIEGQWIQLVVEPLAQVQQELPSPVLILIDGIDECASESDQAYLVRSILRNMDKFGPKIKLLLTFRPQHNLQQAVSDFYISESWGMHLGDSQADYDDVRSYLGDAFADLDSTRHLVLGNVPWPPAGAIDQLTVRTQGQFIYASTAVGFISDETKHPVSQLKSLLNNQFNPAQALDNLYLMILVQIEDQLPFNYLQGLWHFLVHLSFFPSSPQSLAFHCGLDLMKVDLLLKKLSLLIHTQGEVIGFHHTSFIHFIVKPLFPHPYCVSHPYLPVFASHWQMSTSYTTLHISPDPNHTQPHAQTTQPPLVHDEFSRKIFLTVKNLVR
ncbi:hypothetical protein BDN72DRAFT_826318 [Pluteus cervinus]|uniref:Uncharacterized protein n=1 Tax=Pluteus cervinus TaxID=181527 RepID=A0ACD3AD21_9AGAR|nr:hypothetical protein BDN72DRAFT_826318 [Pluteus cervinus]